MPWKNQAGGPWGGGPKGPWGGGGPQPSGSRPPDLEELLRRGQDQHAGGAVARFRDSRDTKLCFEDNLELCRRGTNEQTWP